MNYSDLKEIIKHLKRIVPCNSCKKKFGDEELQVVSTFNNEGLFHLNCKSCSNQLLVHAAIVSKTDTKTNFNVQMQRTDGNIGSTISTNEILDIHNFLNQFNGDFKQLFTP